MTDKEILQKAIEKANKNMKDGTKFTLGLANYFEPSYSLHYYHIIFDKNFAKAFFDNEEYLINVQNDGFMELLENNHKQLKSNPIYKVWVKLGKPRFLKEPKKDSLKMWQYHLRKLVLEENPLQYLKNFL